MAEPFIFIGTNKLKEGKLEDFKKYWQEFCEFIEANEPRLIAFNAYVDEDGSEVAIVQVHPDVESMEYHMTVIREHLEHASGDFLDGTTGMQVFGTLSDAAVGMIRQWGSQVPLTVKPLGVGGFTRSSADRTPVAL